MVMTAAGVVVAGGLNVDTAGIDVMAAVVMAVVLQGVDVGDLGRDRAGGAEGEPRLEAVDGGRPMGETLPHR
jgi:hypothetical protein